MCQIPTVRPLTSSYVWHFLFLITTVTNGAFRAKRQWGFSLLVLLPTFELLLLSLLHQLASRALQALFLPCFLVFLKNRIISLGFNICFPLLFLTVAHSVFLFLGCQGQPGEGPVWLGWHIWWGSKGRGSDQHRGQWSHRQGSGVDLW